MVQILGETVSFTYPYKDRQGKECRELYGNLKNSLDREEPDLCDIYNDSMRTRINHFYEENGCDT